SVRAVCKSNPVYPRSVHSQGTPTKSGLPSSPRCGGWWLSHQRLMAKPWLDEGVIGEFPGGDRLSAPPATIGLGVFLLVAGSLLSLLMSAYVVRMQLLDWRPLPVLPLLWFNTGVLVLSSVILQWAQAAARRGDYDRTVTGVLCAGVSAVVFLTGQ